MTERGCYRGSRSDQVISILNQFHWAAHFVANDHTDSALFTTPTAWHFWFHHVLRLLLVVSVLSLPCWSVIGDLTLLLSADFPRVPTPDAANRTSNASGSSRLWGVPAWGPALNITLHNPVDTSATSVRKARLSLNDARTLQGRLSFLRVEATEKNHLSLVCRKTSKQLVSQLIACLRLL